MTTEHLIEKAAKAMANAPHAADWDAHSDDEREWYRKDAAVALAVFEEAHTPTNHERTWVAGFLLGCGVAPERADEYAEKFLAGFRRSEVPEPRFPYASDWEQPETIIERVLDDAGYDLFQPWRTGVVNAIATWVNEAGRAVESQGEHATVLAPGLDVLGDVPTEVVEPQGEPSDAQVRAAAESIARDDGQRIDVVPEWADAYMPIARAALKAAFDVKGES